MTDDPNFASRVQQSLLMSLGKGTLVAAQLLIPIAVGFWLNHTSTGDLSDLRQAHDHTLSDIQRDISGLSDEVRGLRRTVDDHNVIVDGQIKRADDRLTLTEERIEAIADRLAPVLTQPGGENKMDGYPHRPNQPPR